MTLGRELFLGLMSAAAVAAADPTIQFTGVLTADGKTQLALTDKASDTTAWVEDRGEFKGYAITRYDAMEETIVVTKDGKEYRLSLAAPQQRSAPRTGALGVAAPPTTNESAIRSIRSNLRSLVAAARQYQTEKGVASVSYTELVGPGKFIGDLKSIAGENYSTLNFTPDVTAVSVTTTDGTNVAIDFSTGLAQAPTPPTAPAAPTASSNPPAPRPAPTGALAANPAAAAAANPVTAVAAAAPVAPTDAPRVAPAMPPLQEALPPTGREPVSPTYVVQGGDTWQKVAERTGVTVPDLQRLNPTVNGGSLPAGETIRIK